ncbi:hypothetical protein DL93DRAFT_2233831 [Clavulina sp. PMI_390]|nr:hypothetical protein DL93DRAFT_2233831 [Clavulina sp. PMI_390]
MAQNKGKPAGPSSAALPLRGLVTSAPQFTVPTSEAIEMSLEGFCNCVDEYEGLKEAAITTAELYCTKRRVVHRFVVMELSLANQPSFWLRLDRRPDSEVSSLKFLKASGETKANDKALLSGTKEKLVTDAKLEVSRRLDHKPLLADLNRLLRIMIEELQSYGVWPKNCWFFCSLIMQHFSAIEDGSSVGSNRDIPHGDMGEAIRNKIFARYRAGSQAALGPTASTASDPHHLLPISDMTTSTDCSSDLCDGSDVSPVVPSTRASRNIAHILRRSQKAHEKLTPSTGVPSGKSSTRGDRYTELLPLQLNSSSHAQEPVARLAHASLSKPSTSRPIIASPNHALDELLDSMRSHDNNYSNVARFFLEALAALEQSFFISIPMEAHESFTLTNQAANKLLLFHFFKSINKSDALNALNGKAHMRKLYESLNRLLCTLSEFSCPLEVFYLVSGAHQILPAVCSGYEMDREHAQLLYLEGLMRSCHDIDKAIRAIQLSIQHCSEKLDANDILAVEIFIRCHNTLASTHLREGNASLSLQHALEAVRLAEHAIQGWATAPNGNLGWPRQILIDGMINAMAAHYDLKEFAPTHLYGRKAVLAARELFRLFPSKELADAFGWSLQLYEALLRELVPERFNDFDTMCSQAEWKAMLAQLDPAREIRKYIAIGVEGFNDSGIGEYEVHTTPGAND